jgi:signal peptidase I
MVWLAGLTIGSVLLAAFAMAFARLGMALAYGGTAAKRGQAVGDVLESLLYAWVLVFLIVRPLLVEPFSIPSPSMRDTLQEGDRILVSKYDYRFGRPRRGDIIVFKSPPAAGQNEADFVKRLIGLPGDTIDVRNGGLILNGKPLDEPYVREPMFDPPDAEEPPAPKPPYHVPPGRYFMMGDNRNDSADSRVWGYLDAERIKGRAVSIFWPPRRVRSLRRPIYATADD